MLRISCVPIVLGDFGCDVTCQACRDNSQIRYRTRFQASSGNLDSTNLPGYEVACSVAVVSTSPAKNVTLPNSKWRQDLHRLFIPVERRLIAA